MVYKIHNEPFIAIKSIENRYLFFIFLDVTLQENYDTKYKINNNMIEAFGINAGKIWTILDEKGKQNIKEVKKATKFTDKNLYAALGWLGREGKIKMEELDNDIIISLV